MRINHNLSSMNSHRLAGMVNGRLSRTLERMSTGLRVNRAADDATSLAVSEKFKARIGGYTVGIENTQVGISIIQTADQALQSIQDMLRRARDLSIRCANGDMTDKDREQFEQEVNHLKDEINRVVDTTEYNTKKLFLDRYEEMFTAESSINWADPIKKNEKLIDSNGTTNVAPTYSADGSKIAYAKSDGDYELYVYDIDTQTETRLTTDAHQQLNPVWAPDGDLIYSYQDGGTGANSIQKMNVDTGATQDLTQPGGFTLMANPAVSADGSTVVFRGRNPGVAWPDPASVDSLWVASTTKQDQTPSSPSVYRLGGMIDIAPGQFILPSTPSISPEGDRVVFSARNILAGTYHVYSGEMTSDLTDFQNSIDIQVTSSTDVLTPEWSSDNYLLYSQNDGVDYEINVMRVNSMGIQIEAPIQLTDNAGINDVSAEFHPDGQKLLYASNADGNYDVYEATLNINRTQTLYLATEPSDIDMEVTVNGTAIANDPEDGYIVAENMIHFYGDAAPVDGDVIEVKYHPKTVEMILQVGYAGNDRIDISLPTSLNTERLGIDGISVLHAETAEDAISDIDAALDLVSQERGDLGAQQNRLERTSQELASRREYLQRSESRIRDADMAVESMFMVRDQILQQSSTQIMVQANNMAQSVLTLLNG